MKRQVLPGGFGFPLGFAGGFVITVVTGLDGKVRPVTVLVLLAILVAAVSAASTVPAGAGTAVVCWGLYASFADGTLGDMAFDQMSGFGFAVLLLAVALGLAVRALFWPLPRPKAFVAAPRRSPGGRSAVRSRS